MLDQTPKYANAATSLFDCGVSADIIDLKATLIESFKKTMAVNLCESHLTDEEQIKYKILHADKYSKDSWNLHGADT